MCMRVYVCVYIYVCVHIYIDEIRWFFLCLFLFFVVSFTQCSFSYNCAYDFFLTFTFLFARSWHFYTACFIADPTLFSPAMPLFYFPTKPRLYALAAEAQYSASQCICYLTWPIGQMLLYPSPLHMVLPPKCSLFISPQAFWLSWGASTVKINGFALCLWWLVDFSA